MRWWKILAVGFQAAWFRKKLRTRRNRRRFVGQLKQQYSQMIHFCIYDTKLVNFFSMAFTDLSGLKRKKWWRKREQKCDQEFFTNGSKWRIQQWDEQCWHSQRNQKILTALIGGCRRENGGGQSERKKYNARQPRMNNKKWSEMATGAKVMCLLLWISCYHHVSPKKRAFFW